MSSVVINPTDSQVQTGHPKKISGSQTGSQRGLLISPVGVLNFVVVGIALIPLAPLAAIAWYCLAISPHPDSSESSCRSRSADLNAWKNEMESFDRF